MAYKIYQVTSDPYQLEDGHWMMAVLWMDDETGEMGQGQISVPFEETGFRLQKYFRQNVDPLDDESLQKIIEESQKGVMQ